MGPHGFPKAASRLRPEVLRVDQLNERNIGGQGRVFWEMGAGEKG